MNDIPLGAKMSTVQERLGAPETKDTTDATETLGYTFVKWQYPDLVVEFADTNVAYLTCLGARCHLAGQIALGAPRSAVEALLGAPLPPRPGNPLPTGQVMYVGLKSDCGLTLEYSDNRVTMIKLWCDYS